MWLWWFKVFLLGVTVAGLSAASWQAVSRWRVETEKLGGDGAGFLSLATPGDFVLAGLLYAAGLSLNGWVLRDALRQFGVTSPMWRAVAAQYLGHVGKYVPGKALVIVLRAWAINQANPVVAPEENRGRLARISGAVFLETLLMMSVGATLAGVLAMGLSVPPWIKVSAGVMATLAALPTLPPLLTRLLTIVRRRRGGGNEIGVELRIRWSFWIRGWFACAIGWGFVGLSVALLMRAIPWVPSGDDSVSPGALDGPQLWMLATSGIAIGMVLGFASLLPGGAGVRELATLCVLSPVVGPTHGLLTVIAARLLFLVTEMIVAALGYAAIALAGRKRPIPGVSQ